MSRRAGAGIVLVAVYVLTVVATRWHATQPVRPLFEGIAPPQAYQWVNPPPEFRAGNTKPVGGDTDIPIAGGKGSKAIGLASPDGQFVVNLPDGAIAEHDGDVSANARIDPLDATKLPRLPRKLQADGNAYRLRLDYRPSRTAIGKLAKAGNVFLTVPSAATALFFSSDGRAWREVPHQAAGGPGAVGATIDAPGWFVSGASRRAAAKRSSAAGTILVAAVTVLLALAVFFGPTLLRRRRARGRSAGRGKGRGPTRRAKKPRTGKGQGRRRR